MGLDVGSRYGWPMMFRTSPQPDLGSRWFIPMSPRTTGHFDGFDLEGFWSDHEYYAAEYTEPVPSEELIASVETELGYRLPDSFVEFARRTAAALSPGGCYAFRVSRIGRRTACRIVQDEKRLVALDD